MQRREPASQYTYEELKAALLDGALAYGHLDIQRLADRFRVSPTPVREALARLAAERLIEFSAGHGYAASPPPAHILRDLYAWSGELVRLALDAGARAPLAVSPSHAPWRGARLSEDNAYAHGVSRLFGVIVDAQTNQEIVEKLSQANDRLFRARVCEPLLWPEASSELAALESHWREGANQPLRDRLREFHAVRAARAALIAERLAADARKRASA